MPLFCTSMFVHNCQQHHWLVGIQEMGVSIDNMQKWTQDATLRFTRRKAPPASVVLQQMKQQQQQQEGGKTPPGPPPAAEASMQRPATCVATTAALPAPQAMVTAAATAGFLQPGALAGAAQQDGRVETAGAGGQGPQGPMIAVGDHWDADYDAAAELLMPWRYDAAQCTSPHSTCTHVERCLWSHGVTRPCIGFCSPPRPLYILIINPC